MRNDQNRQEIHVFDVDGTLTRNDSFLLLLQYFVPSLQKRIALWLSLLPVVLPEMIKGNLWKLKLLLLSKLWNGCQREHIEERCKLFFDFCMKKNIRQTALEYMEQLRQKDPGVQLVLLSASCTEWLKPLADYVQADLICTELAYDGNQVFTGRFATPNCKGKEKKRRLLLKYPAAEYAFICYGNTLSDKQLQSISKKFYYRYF